MALLPKEPSAPYCLPPAVLAHPHAPTRAHTHPFLPSHVWLARKEGAAPYAQVRRISQQALPVAEVDVVAGAPQVLRPKSAPSWVAMMQAQRCIPNPHPHPNLCTHPPSVPAAEMGRDHERQIGKGPLPHRGMP